MDRAKSFLSASALALYVHFALQLVAGGVLAMVYRADPEGAHDSVARLHQGGWAVLQGFHYWGSAVMIVHSVLHLAAVTWAGWFKGPQVRAYLAALVLTGLSFAFQLSGNLLPWDRHGVQTASVEGQIAARVPKVGPAVSKAMLGGDSVSAATLDLWWKVHAVALPIILLLAIGLGLTVGKTKGAKWTAVVPALVALGLSLFVAAPFGSAAYPADYALADAKPSWYTLPMHGLLVWGDKIYAGGGWLGTALAPALVAAFFLLLPFFKKATPSWGRIGLAAFAVVGILATVTSGGTYAPLVGSRDPRQRAIVQPAKVETKNVALAAKGRTLFKAQNCNGCHGEDGLKGAGGPSLANLWKEHPEAEYTMRYVKNPQAVEKGSTMPAYGNLKEEELRALAEFLRFPR